MLKYIVQPGDTLHLIALRFKTTIYNIMKTNMIYNPYHIHPGQLLYIPINDNTAPKYRSENNIFCDFGIKEKVEFQAPPFCTKMIPPGLLILLSISQRVYKANDTITFNLFKINLSSHSITLHYNTGQRYDFKIIYPSGHTLWLWSKNKTFIQALGSISLDAGQSILYNESFTLPINSKPGLYKVLGWNTARETQNFKLHLPIYITN